MPSDGKVYLSDAGELCKIDKRGKPYKVGLIPTRRPVDKYTPEEWAKLGRERRGRAIAKEKKEAKKLEKKMKKAAKKILKEEKKKDDKGDEAASPALPSIISLKDTIQTMESYPDFGDWSWGDRADMMAAVENNKTEAQKLEELVKDMELP